MAAGREKRVVRRRSSPRCRCRCCATAYKLPHSSFAALPGSSFRATVRTPAGDFVRRQIHMLALLAHGDETPADYR
jgi:hypothetical protein